jgi:hypothetical protein
VRPGRRQPAALAGIRRRGRRRRGASRDAARARTRLALRSYHGFGTLHPLYDQ